MVDHSFHTSSRCYECMFYKPDDPQANQFDSAREAAKKLLK